MQQLVRSDGSAGARTYSERPAFASIYEIAGRFLLFDSPKGDLPSGLGQVLEGFYFTPINGDTPQTPDANIRFHLDSSTPVVQTGFQSFEISDGGVCHTDGRSYIFDFGNWRVLVHPLPSREIDVVMRTRLDVERADQLQVLNYAISAALRRCGLYELHSGAVVTPEDRGVLIVGPSGSGKSTLVLQLASTGWQYLTDDVLLLGEVDGIIAAHPLRRAFAVTETSVAASGHRELQEAFIPGNWFDSSKKRFAPHEFFPSAFVESCQPRAICFPMITQDELSVVKQLSSSEAMIELLKMCPWACYDRGTSGGHLRVLGALAKQCVAFKLIAGRDLLRDPARVSGLVLDQTDRKEE